MKKLIAIAVVFALVAGVAFAVDLSGDVAGSAKLFKANSGGGGARIEGEMHSVKLEGSGEVMDGKFGAHLRATADFWGGAAVHGWGFAWWKPIDQFKLILGQSGAADGFWGKNGISCWNFNQKANDGISPAVGLWGPDFSGMKYEEGAWYGGLNDMGVFMEIKPMDMLGINIGIPVGHNWNKDIIKAINFQVDLNFAFGNIAISYGDESFYAFFGGSFGAISLDVGLSMRNLFATTGLSYIYFGADLKYAAGAFGIKFRTMEGIPVKGGPFYVNTGVLPYFAINDNMTVFFNAEMGMSIWHGLGNLGWLVNPYLRVGAEWGPSFYVGFQVYQETRGGVINFSLPIGVTVGF